MILTNEQEQAIKIILERYKNKEKFSVLAGYAGVGKTTCIKFIVDALLGSYGIKEDEIVFTAFTGKACQVMQKRGNKPCMTLHKLLYKSIPKATGGYIRIPKKIGE